MPEVDPVTLRLFVENGQAVAALNRYARTSEQSFGVVQRGAVALERTMGGLAGVVSGISVAALARSFLDIADTAKTLDAQLRLATSGFGTFAQAQEDVRRIAATTRSGLEETASLYGNFARGAKELGADQEAAARATETFSKTLKISGADANQASSATLQFGQALAAGALRGDELNSILEASPRLARLLAESFGMPIGKIKELGEEGKLTSDKLLNALTNTKFTAGIDREFAELPVTFQDAMTQVENAAIITFGAFDRGGQFSTALANFIMQGSDGFEEMERDALEFGIEVRSTLEGLSDAFDPLIEAARSAFGQIGDGAKSLSDRIRPLLGEIDSITGAMAGSESGFEQWINKRLYGQESKGTNLLGAFNKGQRESELRGQRAAGLTPVSRVLEKLSQGAKDAAQPNAPRSTSAGSGKNSKAAANKAAAEARKAEQERLRAIRDDASKARESAQLQDDITAARAALAVANEDILAFNLTQIESERQQRIADYETRRKLGQIGEKELADRIAAVNEIADLQRQRVEQIAAENQRQDDLSRLQASVQDNSDLLRAQSDLVASREQRRDIELRLLDLAYEQERAELEAVIASGTATAAQKEIAEQRLRILDQLKSYDAERIKRDNESPLARYSRSLGESSVGDQVEGYVVDELKAVQDGIASALQKAIGTDDPLISGLINLFIQEVIMKPIAAALASNSEGGGGGTGIIGAIAQGLGAIFGGARANGGPVSSGKTYLVGERGPELFRPGASGAIVPNHELVGGAARGMTTDSAVRGPSNTTVISAPQFNLKGTVITAELYADMQRISEASAAQAGATAYKQSMKDAPGAVRRAQRFRTT